MLRHHRAHKLAALVAVLGAFALSAAPAGAATVENGSFETGDFTGWTTQQVLGSSGDWYVYSGTLSPASEYGVEAPPCGTYAAISDQYESSSQVLYQDIALEAGMTHTLSMQLAYWNRADAFYIPDPDTLSPFIGEDSNQQYRVELIDPTADPFTVDPGDIWLEILRTEPGDPLTMSWTAFNDIDLTPWAGETVRLRFAQVDNEYYFQAAVDCVEVLSQPPATTTTTSTTTTSTTAPLPVTPVTTRAATVTTATPAFTG